AALSLGRIGKAARIAVPDLVATLKDKHPGTRAAAAEALGRIGPDAKEALPVLIETLKDKSGDPLTRSFAALALAQIGGPEEAVQALPTLIETIADPQAAEARIGAARVVGKMGKEAAPAVPVLAKALAGKDVELRRAAVAALGEIGPDA